jgi:RND family efflux transporter MFP subunit
MSKEIHGMDVKTAVCVAVASAWPLAGPAATAPSADNSIRTFTKPSADVTLSFVQPGRSLEILFKEGAVVKAGQVVVRLDDSLERAQMAQIQAQSDDTTQIRASEASWQQKKVDLERLEKAAGRKAATELEVEHARLEAKIAELSLQLAQFEHKQAGLKLEEAKIRVDVMQIKSPIDGRVEELFRKAGESVNALDKVIRLVQIDPLWIEASLPTVTAASLKSGSTVTVEFPAPQPMTSKGRITFIAAVGDSASQTIKARIEVPNPSGRPAGEQVRVICPEAAPTGAVTQ